MKRLLLLAVSLAPFAVSAQVPSVVSDPLDPSVTHCGFFFDALPKAVLPVVPDVGGNICQYDLAGISNGSHTLRATAIAVDPVFGTEESAESLPLSFVKPGQPGAPGLLRLRP